MVSVIVPTYNHEKYIRQALDSILMQKTKYSMEILVGDDGSTDKTPEIVREYYNKYPHLFRLFLQEKNIGATRNAYNLLTNARGMYLATLEGDDFWTDPNKIEKQINFLESHPEYIGCTHKFSIVDENGKLLKNQMLSWVKQKETFTLKDFDGVMMPGQPSTFVRRNIFLESECDYSQLYKIHTMISDRTAMLVFLCRGNFYTFDSKMSVYRLVTNKSSSNITSKQYVDRDDATVVDFKILSEMELFGCHVLKKKISFVKRKNYLLAKSILYFVLRKQDFSVTQYIFHELKTPLKAVLSVPFNIILICYEYYKYHYREEKM